MVSQFGLNSGHITQTCRVSVVSIPIKSGSHMIYIDEWEHSKWSAFGMLTAESIMALIEMILFITNLYW
jgi:hypothetical protein